MSWSDSKARRSESYEDFPDPFYSEKEEGEENQLSASDCGISVIDEYEFRELNGMRKMRNQEWIQGTF